MDIGRTAELFGAHLLDDVPISASDETLMALVLGYSDGNVDSIAVSHRLFAEFSTLSAIIAASPDALVIVEGMTPRAAAFCKFLHLFKTRSLKSRLPDRIQINGSTELRDYLRVRRGHANIESFAVLFLDSDWRLLREVEFGQGTIDHVTIYPREVIKRALQIGASKLVLTHNHPSQQARPSRMDIELTQLMVAACAPLGIVVADHVIVVGNDCISMRQLGLMASDPALEAA